MLFKDLLKKKQKADEKNSSALPVKGGRQSVPDDTVTLFSILQEYVTLEPDYPIKLLKVMETLAMYHADFSYAVDNIRQLGNTPYNITFDSSVSEDTAKEMIALLKEKSKKWYAYSGGLTSLVTDLLSQVAISGAVSGEFVPSNDLSEVSKVVIVSPKNIRFKYKEEQDLYIPYQKVNNRLTDNLIELNTLTYNYIALARYSEKPYAIPPFLSALENISIGRDMQENFKYVIKKLGTLGFLEVLVNGIEKKRSEDDDEYFSRTKRYLDKVVPEIEKGMSKGFVVGFKDMHEFNLQNTTANAQGSKDLVEINDTKTMAGFKQDPMMFGRNFSTTETLGRVILAKMTTQVGSYQKIVATFLENLFALELKLQGYDFKYIDVEFEKPMVGDKGREEEAYGKKLANLDILLAKGVIDIYTYSIEAGYDEPADPDKYENSLNALPDITAPKKEDVTGDEDVTDGKTTENNLKTVAIDLGKYYDEYEYLTDDSCCSHTHSFDKAKDDKVSEFVRKYYASTKVVFDKATKKSLSRIAKALLELPETATEQEIVDSIIYNLYKNWKTDFVKPQKRVIKKFIEASYDFFRKDKSVFGRIVDKIPDGTFSQIDLRALKYFKDADTFYLGKFITDEDLKKQIVKYIKGKYLTRELPIGDNIHAISEFKLRFGEVIQGQDWKIRQIIDTTINNMRNTASINYMKQAKVDTYEIMGVNDSLQCGYCSNLQGYQFSVERAVDHIDQFVKSDPSQIGLESPFITSMFKNPDELKNFSGEELQSLGVHKPPFHPHCRDKVVAVM